MMIVIKANDRISPGMKPAIRSFTNRFLAPHAINYKSDTWGDKKTRVPPAAIVPAARASS